MDSATNEFSATIGASTLLRVDDSPPFLRMMLPAVLIAMAMEAGLGALLLDHEFWAGLTFAACTFALVWRASDGRLLEQPKGLSKRFPPTLRRVAFVFLLIGIALMPFLKRVGNRTGAGRHPKLVTASALTAPRVHASGAYSGVILFLPQKPKPIVVPVPVKTDSLNHGRAKPTVIPFDGVYWYYQPPDDGPEPDARVVHGDPAKVNIRATDRLAILMQAHQYLGSSIKMDCCRTLRMDILNADTQPGVIYMEVVLRDTRSKSGLALKISGMNLYKNSEIRTSLGSELVRSTDASSNAMAASSAGRRPVEESLSFPFPAQARMKQFDEITVIFRPSFYRDTVGTRIAIRQFVLTP